MPGISSVCQTALRGLAIFLGLLPFLAASFAGAAEFSVNPVRVALSVKEKVAALHVRNTGETDVVIQAKVVSWNQQHAKDSFQSTKEVLVTPPIVTIPPGGTQIIRAGLRRAPDTDTELSYRLFLEEVPDHTQSPDNGLRMITRLSLPVFVAPGEVPASPSLRWAVQRGPEQSLLVAAYNDGNGHAQIANLSLALPDGQRLSLPGLHYLLPGNDNIWVVDTRDAAITRTPTVTLSATVNGLNVNVRMQVQ